MPLLNLDLGKMEEASLHHSGSNEDYDALVLKYEDVKRDYDIIQNKYKKAKEEIDSLKKNIDEFKRDCDKQIEAKQKDIDFYRETMRKTEEKQKKAQYTVKFFRKLHNIQRDLVIGKISFNAFKVLYDAKQHVEFLRENVSDATKEKIVEAYKVFRSCKTHFYVDKDWYDTDRMRQGLTSKPRYQPLKFKFPRIKDDFSYNDMMQELKLIFRLQDLGWD